MTYKEAKNNFAIFGVFVPKRNKKGKLKLEQVGFIPDYTEGKIGVFDAEEGFLTSCMRLCFIANWETNE